MSRRSNARRRRSEPTEGARLARVNELLREVLAEELERIGDGGQGEGDPEGPPLTVTGVSCRADLGAAVVYLDALDDTGSARLSALRSRLQRAVAEQVRLKRTPLLSFAADPAVAEARSLEQTLARLRRGTRPDGEAGELDLRPPSSPEGPASA